MSNAEAAGLAARLGNLAGGKFAVATMHTPLEIADGAMAFIADKGIDGLIAVGGGLRPHQ
jgi:maleylacetate reductase